jgi:ribosomal protein L16 Arg81 hydroxylase
MEDEKFHSGWVTWMIANLVLGAGFQDMLQTMKEAGFSEAYALARLAEYEQNGTIVAARQALAVQRKAADILQALGKLEHRSPFSKQIDRARDLSAADFYRDYFFRNRPVVLQGLASQWKAMQLWTPEYFSSRFGDIQVEVVTGRESDPQHEYNLEQHKTRLPMREYVRMVVEGGETNDYYLVAQNYLISRPEFQELYSHVTGLDGYLDEANVKGRVRIWFGPKGTITRLHHDAAPVLIAQVYGHKQVKLISPFHLRNVSTDGDWLCTLDLDHLDYTQSPQMRNVDILEVVLEPGELLFIPLGWWHWVKGLDVTISLSLDNFQVARDEIEMNWKRDMR